MNGGIDLFLNAHGGKVADAIAKYHRGREGAPDDRRSAVQHR